MSRQLDAILGKGDFPRELAPEPSLLPLLVRFASPSRVVLAARHAEYWAIAPALPVPALGRATARVIARRAKVLAADSLEQAARSLPLLGTLCALSPMFGASPELAVRTAVRADNRKAAEEAIRSAFSDEERMCAIAAALPLAGTPAALLELALPRLASISIVALGAVASRLGGEANGRLLDAWLSAPRNPREMVAGLVELLPALDEPRREDAARAALELIEAGALVAVPTWAVCYLIRRLRETDAGAQAEELAVLALRLPAPWQEVAARAGRVDPADDEAALLASHPGAAQASGPILRAEADEAIDRTLQRWAGGVGVKYRGELGRPPRHYLQAQVEELHGTMAVARTDAFARGQRHRVSVSLVDRESLHGILADRPVPLDFSSPHQLYVSVFAPWLEATAPVPIWAPAAGDTTRASVEFLPPAQLNRVELTVVVLERIGDELTPVQSGVIAGDVVDAGTKGQGISFRIHPHPVRPPQPSTDGVTIVLGDDTLAMYGAPGREARFPVPGQFKAFRAELGDQVLELWARLGETRDPGQLASSLVRLAASGSRVLECLDKRLQADAETRRRLFRTDETVRLWSRDLDTDLPLEFIYDGAVPDYKKPALCAHFFEALETACCRKCENRAGSVCAFDFWGFRRRIERRVADDRDAASGHGVAEQAAQGQLVIDSPAAFGASVNVSAESRAAVLARLKSDGIEVGPPAADWAAWKKLLETRPHRLLVLLSHTEGGTALEIGGDTIDRQWITRDFVNPQDAQPGPLVLLTGCETARPDAAFLSFVARFLDQGAAVVVGTLAPIREDASAEATQGIIDALREVVVRNNDQAPRTVGEVMRRARCRLMAERDLTGLNLVAYGDADWRLRPPASR